MGLLSRVAVKGGLALVGLVGITALAVSPASAENASIQGAVTRSGPAGFSASLSGEMVAPEGMHFPGPLVVSATYDFANQVPMTLTVNGGALAPNPASPADSLKAAVVTELNGLDPATQAGLDAYAAILKAAAGADGLE